MAENMERCQCAFFASLNISHLEIVQPPVLQALSCQ